MLKPQDGNTDVQTKVWVNPDGSKAMEVSSDGTIFHYNHGTLTKVVSADGTLEVYKGGKPFVKFFPDGSVGYYDPDGEMIEQILASNDVD